MEPKQHFELYPSAAGSAEDYDYFISILLGKGLGESNIHNPQQLYKDCLKFVRGYQDLVDANKQWPLRSPEARAFEKAKKLIATLGKIVGLLNDLSLEAQNARQEYKKSSPTEEEMAEDEETLRGVLDHLNNGGGIRSGTPQWDELKKKEKEDHARYMEQYDREVYGKE